MEIRFYQHHESKKRMVSGSVVAAMAEIPLQALADNIGEWLYATEIARRYWPEFAVLSETNEIGMTLDGLRVLQGHLEPQYPRMGARLAPLRMAMEG